MIGALPVLAACSDPALPDPGGVHSGVYAPAAPAESWWAHPFASSDLPPETAGTGDTGAPTLDTGPRAPCDHQPVTTVATFTGNDFGDWAGRWVDVADIDGDGCEEVLVSEPGLGDYYVPYHAVVSAVHLLQDPWTSGPLHARAFATFSGIGGADAWGGAARLLPQAGQVVMGGFDDAYHTVHLSDIPVGAGEIPWGQPAASLDTFPDAAYGLGDGLGSASNCPGPALCVTSIHSVPFTQDYAGMTWVFELPLTGDIPVASARATYRGDTNDRAEMVLGDGDLDGDGVNDLVLGAYWRLGTGVVAVLLAPPDGDHRVWDIANATFSGETYGGEFGLGLAVGDLDGDGHVDVVAGEIANGGAAHVFLGPFAGDRPASAADLTIGEGRPGQWVGYDAAIGDVDGDGAADLAVGAPWSIYTGPEPGQVLLFPAPIPGVYAAADAPVVLVSGAGLPDAFGMSIEGGDVDGDGLYDLVIGAPADPTIAAWAGSVSIVFGASLP